MSKDRDILKFTLVQQADGDTNLKVEMNTVAIELITAMVMEAESNPMFKNVLLAAVKFMDKKPMPKWNSGQQNFA